MVKIFNNVSVNHVVVFEHLTLSEQDSSSVNTSKQVYSSFTTVHSPEPLFSSDGAVDRFGSMREGGAIGTMVGIPGM